MPHICAKLCQDSRMRVGGVYGSICVCLSLCWEYTCFFCSCLSKSTWACHNFHAEWVQVELYHSLLQAAAPLVLPQSPACWLLLFLESTRGWLSHVCAIKNAACGCRANNCHPCPARTAHLFILLAWLKADSQPAREPTDCSSDTQSIKRLEYVVHSFGRLFSSICWFSL